MQYRIETVKLGKYFNISRGLRKFFPLKRKERKQIWAVREVNISLERGKVCCLVGPNGAGKSTFLKILASLIVPTKGAALVNGYDIRKDENRVRKSIGLLTGDERSLYWRLSGRENLLFFASLYGIFGKKAERTIRELCELMKLEGYLNRPLGECTSGIRERFSLARMLLHNPEVLLMDEPTQNLDPIIAREIRAFIKETLVKEKGKTVLYTTHHLLEMEGFADWTGVMVNGEVVVSGTYEEIRKKTPVLVKDMEEVLNYWVKKSENEKVRG